ncbi:hypothetical protein D5Z92_14665 [Listeria monocytogenes]|uniref:hypothetical protein n=1 Tax=Listeria monocytogenes TaxID=1639 RepID=UPI0011EB8900|nr:hypothetical protein [Listeria monocytogenes]EAF6699934.1 hypothetical protein [Listeria monocytogenes]EAH3791831.1 hypothetical protein [Listeria monocytogenes]TYU82734.1 hypothetical protein FZX01_15745 [Listeria monocytogenes]
MQDIKQRIRERFGDIAPSELAEILQVAVKKSRYMESGSELVYMDQQPIIYLGRKIDIKYKQPFIARELLKYLEAYPERLGD